MVYKSSELQLSLCLHVKVTSVTCLITANAERQRRKPINRIQGFQIPMSPNKRMPRLSREEKLARRGYFEKQMEEKTSVTVLGYPSLFWDIQRVGILG